MTEDPALAQGTEAKSDNSIPSNGYVSFQLGKIHQVRHSNSVQKPTEINQDAATLASPSGEEHNLPSQSSCQIP